MVTCHLVHAEIVITTYNFGKTDSVQSNSMEHSCLVLCADYTLQILCTGVDLFWRKAAQTVMNSLFCVYASQYCINQRHNWSLDRCWAVQSWYLCRIIQDITDEEKNANESKQGTKDILHEFRNKPVSFVVRPPRSQNSVCFSSVSATRWKTKRMKLLCTFKNLARTTYYNIIYRC